MAALCALSALFAVGTQLMRPLIVAVPGNSVVSTPREHTQPFKSEPSSPIKEPLASTSRGAEDFSGLRAFRAERTAIPLLLIDESSKRQQWTWMVYETKRPIDLETLTGAERQAAFRVMDRKPQDRLIDL